MTKETAMQIATPSIQTCPAPFKQRSFKTEAALSTPAILLVEAPQVSQEFHLNILRLLGCRIDLASTGRQALALSKHHYDLILLDLNLPDLCSFKVSKAIKKHHHPTPVPIIALMTDEHQLQEQTDIDGFILKPVPAEKFISILTHWVK